MITLVFLLAALQDDALESGRAKLKKLDLEGATTDFAKAVEADGKARAARVAHADALFRLGEFERSEAEYTKAIEFGATADLHARRAVVRLRRGDGKGGEKDIDVAFALEKGHVLATIARAQVELAAGNFPECEDLLRLALKAEPANAEGLYLRAIIKGAQRNAKGMIRDLEKAAEADPLHLEARILRATTLSDGGDQETAIAELDALVKIRPSSDGFLALRGMVRARAKDVDGALADYSKAIEMKPDAVEHWLRRANFWRSTAKEQEKAIGDYSEVLKREPEHGPALTGRGYAYCRVKDFKKAGKDMARAYELKVEDPWGAYNLACFHGLRAKEVDGEDRVKAIDKAFEWLKEAGKSGYKKLACGCHQSNLEHLRTDGDLELLRGDARWKEAAAADESD